MKRALIIGLALLTSACATTYGELGGWMDDGVAADQMSADTFRIRSRGNGATEHSTVEDFALLRAAETMRGQCFTHFVVLDGADRTVVDETVTPESWSKTVEEKEVDGKKVKVEKKVYTPASHSITIRPGQDLIVRGLRLRPGDRGPEQAFVTDEILQYVGARVVRRKNSPPPIFPACGPVMG